YTLSSDNLPSWLKITYAERYQAGHSMIFAPIIYGSGTPDTTNTFYTYWANTPIQTMSPYYAVYIWRRYA
ncbi:MAG TPA: hypothetical protein DCW90_21055, partial [Lachnospiraceae bacterium]|nr:hypothetical protein [Lachnospiraceae bacterium]